MEIFLATFMALGILFKIMSFPFAGELLILSMTSLAMFYLVTPILLFRGKKVVDHLFSHLAGLILLVMLISVLFKWMTWAYWQEMRLAALSWSLPFTVILLVLLLIAKQPEKRGFYARIALRILVALPLLVF